MEVAGRTRSQRRQRLIDVLRLRVAGNGCTGGIRFLDEVVAVVGENAGAGTGRFVDSSSEGIIFEGNRTAASGQRDAAQAVLEVPRVARGVRSNHLGLRVAVGV